jgi:hypothetical protein
MTTPTTIERPRTAVERSRAFGDHDAYSAQQVLVAMAFTVAPENLEAVMHVLQTVRSGLNSAERVGEVDLVDCYFGPLLIEDKRDVRLFYAIHNQADGQFETDANEPCIIADRGLLAAARQLVTTVIGDNPLMGTY